MTSRPICVCVLVGLTAYSGLAQTTTAPPTAKAPKGPRVVKLIFTPAPAPEPALKYLLMPSIPDQEPGNAEPILYTASLLAERVRQAAQTEKLYERVIDWVFMPLDKLPREQVVKALDEAKGALRYARLAARREWCVWEVPFRSEGIINTELPALATQRLMARLLILRARLAIAEGCYNDALDDLQTVAAIAHRLGQAPTLIHNLVGVANAIFMARGLENWVNQSGSPNLYWALTDLPRPLVDTRKGLQYEQLWMTLEFPHLRELDSVVLNDQQVRAIHDRLVRLIAENPYPRAATAPAADARERWEKAVAEHQRQAREQLLAAGYTHAFVDAISPEQAVLLRLFDDYRKVRDDFFKLSALPYWQAEEGIARIEHHLDNEVPRLKQEYGSGLFEELMPSLARAHFLRSRADRDITILRCVEAIRLYAAGHDGKLPSTLQEITEVPVPEDPITGRPFVYEFAGDRATLIGRVPDANSEDGVRYELSVKR